MRNKFALIVVGSILIGMLLGCGSINPFSSKNDSSPTSNKSAADKTIDTAIDGEKIGIPECDAIIDDLAAETISDDEGYIVKAFRSYYVSKIREAIKKSVDENKGDPTKLASECKKIKTELDKYRTQEKEKK